MIPSLLRLSCVIIVITITVFTWSPLLTTTAQQQQQTPATTMPSGTGATITTTLTTTPLAPLTPPLTPQEQQQQIRLQNVIASTTLNLQETQKQIGGVVFTPRWSNPVWINANSVAVLAAYCFPGEFADSGQEILGGFELEVLESYGVALPQGFMAWMAVVGNEDIQNRRLPAALGVMCASDLNKPETRVLSPEKQQEINNINEQFVNIQNTQINDIDNLISVINTVTTTAVTPPPPGQNATGTGTGTALLPASQDTIPPTFIGIEDIVTELTSEQSGRVTYAVTAQDNVDGTAKLEADGITITQDNVGGNIAISCEILSGSEFPSGETPVPCVATDQAGNAFRDSFGIIVTPGSNGTINGTGGAGTTTLAAAPVQDTTPPTLVVPEDIIVEASSEEGAVVTYAVTAQDNVDGTATLDENNILTQDNDAAVYANMDGAPPMSGGGGNTGTMTPIPAPEPSQPNAPVGGGYITIVCDPPSPIKFDALIGDAVIRDNGGSASAYNAIPIQCTATDSAGNKATQSFTVTVNPPPGQTPSQSNAGTGGSSGGAEALPEIIDEEPAPAPTQEQPPSPEDEDETSDTVGGEEEEPSPTSEGEEGEDETSDD